MAEMKLITQHSTSVTTNNGNAKRTNMVQGDDLVLRIVITKHHLWVEKNTPSDNEKPRTQFRDPNSLNKLQEFSFCCSYTYTGGSQAFDNLNFGSWITALYLPRPSKRLLSKCWQTCTRNARLRCRKSTEEHSRRQTWNSIPSSLNGKSKNTGSNHEWAL